MMTLTSQLLSIGEKLQKALPGLDRPEATAGGRVKGFLSDVAGTVTSRGLSPLERDVAKETKKKAKEIEPQFVEEATALKLQRDALASERLEAMESMQIKTGQGTGIGGGGSNYMIPPDLPAAPTAGQLAMQKSKQDMVKQIMQLQEQGHLPDRSKAGTLAKSAVRGLTLGVSGRVDPENPLTMAQMERKPMSTGEKVLNVGAELGASFVPYGVMARAIGGALTSNAALKTVATKHPYMFRAVVENFGQEMAEMGIRKGTGQEYSAKHFMIGMALGGVFETGVFGYTRARGLPYAPYKELEIETAIRGHLNTASERLEKSLGRAPTPEEVYKAIQNDPVPGMKDMTFDSAYKESRLAYYRSNMREGIDIAAEPPRRLPDDVSAFAPLRPRNHKVTYVDTVEGDRLALLNGELHRWVDDDELRILQETGMLSPTPGVPGSGNYYMEGGKKHFSQFSDGGKVFIDDLQSGSTYKGSGGQHELIVYADQLPDNVKLHTDPKTAGSVYITESIPIDRVSLIKSADDAVGMVRSGVGEGRMPGLAGDKRIQTRNIARKTISGELSPDEGVAQMDSLLKAYKPTKNAADAEEVLYDPSAWDHTKEFMGKLLNARYLERFGDEGKAIARMIDNSDAISSVRIGNDLYEGLPMLKRLNDVEAQNAADVAEGIATPMNDNVAAFADWWSRMRVSIGDRAEQAGIQIALPDGSKIAFRQRENYLPRVINRDKLKAFLKQFGAQPANQRNAFFESIMENSRDAATGELRIKSVTEAKRLWNEVISKTGTVKYGHLERARTEEFIPKEILEQITDRDVRQILPGYIISAERRIADASQFGPNQEKITELVEAARTKGVDSDTMLEIVNRVTGREAATGRGAFSPGITAVSKAVRTYNVLSKMSLSFISNLGDTVKPFVRSGEFIPTVRGFLKSFQQGGIDQGVRSGVVEDNLRALAQDLGDTTLAEKFLKVTQFQKTESFIRRFNANSAIAYAEVLVKRLKSNPDNFFANRRLAQFLPEPDAAIKRGYLTQAEKDLIGYQGIADSQPLQRLDLPYYWQSPGGRMITQFKSFAYKHMTFSKKFIWDELVTHKNPRPLIAFMVMGQLIGEPVADLKAWIRGRDRDGSISRRIIDNYMTVGGIGLATDFLTNLQYGQMGGGFMKFVAGPTISEIDDILGRLVSGNRVERLTKKAIQQIPLVGPAAANAYSPAKQSYRARTIPIAEDVIQMVEGGGEGGGGRDRPDRRSRPSRPSRR